MRHGTPSTQLLRVGGNHRETRGDDRFVTSRQIPILLDPNKRTALQPDQNCVLNSTGSTGSAMVPLLQSQVQSQPYPLAHCLFS